MATVKEFFSEDDLRVIRYHYQHVVPLEQRLTDEELQTGLHVAASRGLMPPPIANHIYFLKRRNREQLENGEWGDVMKMTVQTGIDGLRLIAERTGKHLGTSPIQYENDQSGWPKRAYCTVFKAGPGGQRIEFTGEAWFDEYAQFRFVKGGGRELTKMWSEKPHIMVGKCCESGALHRAFPGEVSGLYTSEEMGSAEEDVAAVAHAPQEAHRSAPAAQPPMAPATTPAPAQRPPLPQEVGPFVRSGIVGTNPPEETVRGWVADWQKARQQIEEAKAQGLDPSLTLLPAMVADREKRLAQAGYVLKTPAPTSSASTPSSEPPAASSAAPPAAASAPPTTPPPAQGFAAREKIERLAQVAAQACTAYGTGRADMVRLVNGWAPRNGGSPALSPEGKFAADLLESEYQSIVAGFQAWERDTREKQKAGAKGKAEVQAAASEAQKIEEAQAEFEKAASYGEFRGQF